MKLISATGLRAISKIISMLLAAIAVNMIRKGWFGKCASLRPIANCPEREMNRR